MALFRTYHYGSHKWEDYLLDIHQTQNDAANAAKAASEEANEELQRQTGLLNRQIELSEEISGNLNEIRLEMQFGFDLVVDRLDRQIRIVSDVVRSLDAIHQTLQSPLITQANELWRLGEERFKKGLFDRALDAFVQSEQKNEVLFPLQLRIGTLLLEGRNNECNVINLPEAERHLLLAARYAQAEQETTANWREFAGKAYYRAAQAAYLIGKSARENGDIELSRECLARASQHLEKGERIWPEFRGTWYLYAKCQALLGNSKKALDAIEVLSDTDRQFYGTAQDDGDFSSLRDEVEGTFKRAIDHPGPNAARAIESLACARNSLGWARGSNPTSADDKQILAGFDQEFSAMEKRLRTLDVDIDAVTVQIVRFRKEAESFAERVMLAARDSHSHLVASLTSAKSSLEANLNHLQGQKSLTEGSTGIGCLSVIIMYVVLQFGLPILVLPFRQQLSRVSMGFIGGLFFLGGLVFCGIVSFKTGKGLSRHSRNTPIVQNIEQVRYQLRDWERSNPAVIARCQADSQLLERYIQEFRKWKVSNPILPV